MVILLHVHIFQELFKQDIFTLILFFLLIVEIIDWQFFPP